MDPVWKRFKHLPQGVSHAFIAADETIAVCGRSDYDIYTWQEDNDAFKCKNCNYILDGSLIIARMRVHGGGILHV